jgi:DNA-directed RNA polymerase specialized sigma24 family protein
MSPLAVRRYRAERLLRDEFRRLQGQVIAIVARRLSVGSAALDERDLEACYANAWQGLYEAILEGQEITNPAGWLVLVTYRRAVDEQRSRARACAEPCEVRFADGTAGADGSRFTADAACDQDPSGAIADRVLLHHLFEGLRTSMTGQEREAAVLCYLHGLTRAQAAAQMGISQKRMRKLMDGRGPGRPGVSVKLGMLVASIRDGRWCEQQASMMRGLAFGILDPAGERHRIAIAHTAECPACRAYVSSLRGLSVALPPALLPGGLAAAILGAARVGSTVAGAGAGSLAGTAATGARLGAGGGAVASAGTGGAGGGLLLAGGPVGAKLAAGCLLALGIGAGCVGLGIPGRGAGHPAPPAADAARRHTPRLEETRGVGDTVAVATGAGRGALPRSPLPPEAATGSLGGAARAAREFGPERTAGTPAGGSSPPWRSSRARARTAFTRRQPELHSVVSPRAGPSTRAQPSTSAPPQREATPTGSPVEAARAEREFAPG